MCEEAHVRFQRLLNSTHGKLPRGENKAYLNWLNVSKSHISGIGIQDAISKSVLDEINISVIFVDLRDHMFDDSVSNNHIFNLVKLISKTYSRVILFHLGKEFSSQVTGEKIRKKYGKLILFKNQ